MNRARLGVELPPWASESSWDALARDRAVSVAATILAAARPDRDDWAAIDELRGSSDAVVRHLVDTLPRGRSWSARSIVAQVLKHFDLDPSLTESIRHRVGQALPKPDHNLP